jgi:NADH:ubiquinone oxidoreductase subunit 2 (subunit N)
MYLSILIFPLLASIASGFLGRKIGITGSQFISCTFLGISSIFITIAFYQVCLCASPVEINLGSWVDSEFMNISWVFYFDQLTVMLAMAVLYCSTAIHIYSIYYLAEDPHVQRFFSYLSAFTFGMLVLITGGNFFVMFVGWEAIGVVSYLLINFYFTRIQANKAAILAFTMNRQGDMLMSIGFFAIFALFGSLNYSSVFSLVPYMNETAITIIALLLFGGACAKSAQIPLHSWLPGSMEAPTPVSALLHAATLVTAGIYLLLRCSPILEYSPTALMVITIVGASTAFFAATSGLVQNDLKRIIAFSTISQLGYSRVLGRKHSTILSNYLFHYVSYEKIKKGKKVSGVTTSPNCFKREQHTLSKIVKPLLDPWYITGFTDAEGCFSISIAISKKNKTGLQVNPTFSIHLHSKDISLLESIKDYFGVGIVSLENNTKSASYKILSVTNLINIVIPHFDKYPLITQKQGDYLLWKEVIQILVNKEHLNQKGIEKILEIRSSLNLGLSPSLKNRFPNIIPVARPKLINQNISNPLWILGFSEGEGCFFA